MPAFAMSGGLNRPPSLAHHGADIDSRRDDFDPPKKKNLSTFVVRPGEMLWGIARKILHNPHPRKETFTLNRICSTNQTNSFQGMC